MKNFRLSERTLILAIFFFALAVRLLYVVRLSPAQLSPDSADWMGIAANIAGGHGFGDTWRPPGYPAYLAAIMAVFGNSVLVFRIFNSLFGSVTCVLIYFIGKKVFSARVGAVAAVLTCLYPYLIAYTGDLLSETFFTFMVALSILLLLHSSARPGIARIAAAGLVMGLTSLTKSTILPFFVFSCAWFWWRTGKPLRALLLGAFILLGISTWTVRNHFYYRNFIPVSTMWRTAYLAWNDGAIYWESAGEKDSPQSIESTLPVIPGDYQDILKLPRMEQESVFRKKALDWIKANPAKVTWLVRMRLMHFWRLYPMMAYKWQKAAALATSGVYLILGLAGIIASYRNFRITSLFAGLFVLYTAVHLFFPVTLRYRVPIDPYIIIFAAYAACEGVSLLARRPAAS